MAEIRIRIRLTPGEVNVDRARWDAYARDPSGPILRDMIRRANNVEQSARFDAPRDTGTLAATLRTQVDFGGRLPAAKVIAGREGLTPYLGYVLNGTAPHVIEAKPTRPNPHLRFIARGGNVVFRRRVMHPGTRADDFLNRALYRALN